jgi:hypothetical protein
MAEYYFAVLLIIERRLIPFGELPYGKKLIKGWIKGQILNVIQNLYNISKSCVVHHGRNSEFLKSKVGVRQGENLSPLLFAIFLNDIESFFQEKGCEPLSFIENLDKNAINGEIDTFLKRFILLMQSMLMTLFS